ncbi:6729_t:CDS:2 [Funneliformis geosporum]|uniref:6729_t:CDS:1 n=1 Tax=Funneliformis geosporum TaxID=1117311 RepID=A0A9W4X544_9GLOM|nr:6729_t:CDS:2 [Funneliformis geosporum]
MPTSPFDPTSQVYKCANNRYRCKNTGKYFNKGISSHQLAKDVGITQKSAWFVLQRLRYTFQSPIFKTMLDGVVEIDETFIGGKNKNRH